jgi:hypothetical protein
MKQDLSNIIHQIVLDIDNTIEGTFDDVLNRTNVCKTKWIRKGKKVTDSDGNEYVVADFVTDEWIVAVPVNASAPPLEGIITIGVPYFITGTPISANREWTIVTNDVTAKTPIVWYLDFIRFKEFGRESTIEFESDLRIFFLDETDVRNYYTQDHRDNVVKPMTELVHGFIDSVERNRVFKRIEDFEILTFSRFGVEKENGMFQSILDADLSGVELRLMLVKYKENCKC